MLSSREYDAAGIAFLAFASGRRAEKPAIHWHTPENTWACTVYLTPDLPADCGTSLWQHERTGLDRAPVRDDERRLGRSCEALLEELERDSQRRTRWIETDRIGYRFNRAVIYPAYRLHSATRHRGSDLEDGRLYQLLGFRA